MGAVFCGECISPRVSVSSEWRVKMQKQNLRRAVSGLSGEKPDTHGQDEDCSFRWQGLSPSNKILTA